MKIKRFKFMDKIIKLLKLDHYKIASQNQFGNKLQ